MEDRTLGQTLWRSFRKSPKAQLALGIMTVLLVMAVFAPYIAPHPPQAQNMANRLQPPFWMAEGTTEHPLGTNNLGQDILSRMIHGTRISLFVGFVGALLASAIGVPVALLSAYYGGLVDEFFMRFADIFLSVPAILLAVAVIGVLQPSPMNVVAVFVFVSWAWLARTVRGEALAVRERGFVEAAEAMGASDRRIMVRHIFPNVLATTLVITTLYVAIIILWQAALAFLGLSSTLISWGYMLSVGREYLSDAWWLGTFPGVAIFVTVLALNLFGDWLRDTFDVRTR